MNRTERLRRDAVILMNDRYQITGETPREPLPAEVFYLEARALFQLGKISAGRAALAKGDAISGLS